MNDSFYFGSKMTERQQHYLLADILRKLEAVSSLMPSMRKHVSKKHTMVLSMNVQGKVVEFSAEAHSENTILYRARVGRLTDEEQDFDCILEAWEHAKYEYTSQLERELAKWQGM